MTFEDAVSAVQAAPTKSAAIRVAYDILTGKYRGNRVKTYTRFPELFQTDINKLWQKDGFLHCTNLNRLMKTMLLRSGKFTEPDIKTRWNAVWFISPHQYLQLKDDRGSWIDIDMWAKAYGIGFGDHAHGFH